MKAAIHVLCWAVCLLSVSAQADSTYIVQSGDTLDAIARRNHVSSALVIERNALSDPDSLSIGQKLIIPGAPAKPKPMYLLPSELQRTLDRLKVTPRKWHYIVVHHSGTRNGNVRSMDLYHRQKRHMENGLAYHFVIGNGLGMPDGRIEIGNRWKRQIKGGHLASDALNEQSIGICLVGNFETGRPTPQQMRSLYALIDYLEKRCGLTSKAVKTHRQINTKPTDCPGRLFPTKTLMDNI